ncbi:MAG: hypothetical protein DMG15_16125 [Acidobacteria bacterium]|nr:MAG: hypothetical protein DMG15_16125 [Acidobacteriota bacterium]
MNKTMKVFIVAIAVMGVVRFILDASGLPKDVVKYFSMTAIMIIGSLYFAIATATHKERLKASYLLIMPYMTVEVIALGYTWATGHQTIFHAAEYSMGTSIGVHTLGHLIGGFTWEPLIGFVAMELVWGIYAGGRSLLKPKITAA